MKKSLFLLVCLVVSCLLLVQGDAWTQEIIEPPSGHPAPPQVPAMPSRESPGRPPGDDLPPHPQAVPAGDGLWMLPVGAAAPQPAAPQASGGPDTFGYTWSDDAPFNWIDASGATDTGLSQEFGGAKLSGPFAIGFDFKFYENSYSQLYISSAGSVGFTFEDLFESGTPYVPSPAQPNNIISAYLAPLRMNAPGFGGSVRYLHAGAAPNRVFVVQWDQVEDNIGGRFTFQIILHENGDIVLQYLDMDHDNSFYCGTFAGIENASGLDGLPYIQAACNWMEDYNGRAVRFTRPAPAARLHITPRHQGAFVRGGEEAEFEFTLRNTGELGLDTYDLFPASAWPLTLYGPDGVTPLGDSDADGAPDTGNLPMGGTFAVTARVQVPAGVVTGNDAQVQILARSSLDVAKQLTANIDLAVPAPFAQVSRDGDYPFEAVLRLNHPAGRTQQRFTNTHSYMGPSAVANTPDGGFVMAWYEGRCVDQSCNIYVYEHFVAIVDAFGQLIRQPMRLADLSGVTVDTYHLTPSMAVTPDGRIGLLWEQYLYDFAGSGQRNENVYFAVLDQSGNLIHGPENLTNNGAWTDGSDYHVPGFFLQSIAATPDNRFVLAWDRFELAPPSGSCSYCSIEDIYLAVRDSAGAVVQSPVNLTGDTPGFDDGYNYPDLTPGAGNNVLLTFSRKGNTPDVQAMMLNSSGAVVTDMTNVSGDGSSGFERYVDAVRLSGGNYLLAWSASVYPNYELRYALIGESLLRQGPVQTLQHPGRVPGINFASVTSEPGGNGVITWNDSDYSVRLYYALIGGNGALLTPPSIFATDDNFIGLTSAGHGNAPYTFEPPAGVDGVVRTGAALTGGAPGRVAPLPISVANHGAQPATGVVISATLGAGLTYAGDTLGLTPTVNGQTVNWMLPGDMAYLQETAFLLYAGIPADAAIGDRYDVDVALQSDQPDANSADNEDSASIMASEQVLIPVVRR